MFKKTSLAVFAALLGLSLMAAQPAYAAKKKGKKAKSSAKSSVKYDQGSGETRGERDRRLTRECRGRPNAGACEGYAR